MTSRGTLIGNSVRHDSDRIVAIRGIRGRGEATQRVQARGSKATTTTPATISDAKYAVLSDLVRGLGHRRSFMELFVGGSWLLSTTLVAV
jgi:hypothetical protein